MFVCALWIDRNMLQGEDVTLEQPSLLTGHDDYLFDEHESRRRRRNGTAR